MKNLITAALVGAAALGTIPANAQNYDRRDIRDARRDVREERRDVREARKDVRKAQRNYWQDGRRYDYNRVDPRFGGYYADRYYRDGRYYQPRRLSYNDRVYRGNDGRYYCRRSDGTTGLIIGAAGGALLGNALSNGRSGLLGTILGAAAGGAIGSSVDRGKVMCR